MQKLITIGISLTVLSLVLISFKSEKQLPQITNVGEAKELRVMNNVAFKRGEKLTFRLHYGFLEAGEATLGVTEEAKEVAGRKTYHIVGLGETRGAADLFFPVRDRYETYIDEKAIVPWIFLRHVDEGGYKFSQSYVFNHYSHKVNVGNGEMMSIEPNMQDMLSAFYAARNLDLSNAKPGEVLSINCFMDKEIWPLKVKFLGRETIKTDLGKFKCLKYQPVVQKGRVFKDEEDLTIWISDDKNHIPIKGKADILIGSVQVELKNYEGLANPIARVN